MRYAFFGTPEFAARVLRKLIEGGLPPVLVVANPDRPAGRKKIITAPPVKEFLAKISPKTELIQPETLSPDLFSSRGRFDFFVAAAYAKILKKEIISLPRLGTVGVHPSLLPKYRGAAPIQSAILAGEKETGVSLYLMDEKVDHGAVIAKSECPVANAGYEKLESELADSAGELLLKTLPDFCEGKISPVPQNEAFATFTKKFVSEDAFVDEKDLAAAEAGDAAAAEIVERKIRALNPEPGAWTIRNGKRIKLLAAEIHGGKLVLKKIQEAGKTPREI